MAGTCLCGFHVLFFFVSLLVNSPERVASSSDFDSLYVGCYKEKLVDREFSISAGNYNSSDLNPEQCIKLCGLLGYELAGLQHARFCLCAKTFGKHGNSSDCDKNCTGNGAKVCGGTEANSVYNSTAFMGEFYAREPPGPVELFSEVSIRVHYINGSTEELDYIVDLGEGSGYSRGKDLSIPFVYKPIRWGLARITVRNTLSGAFRTLQCKVRVIAPVKHVHILCPYFIEVNTLFICKVKIFQGTDINLEWSYSEGSLSLTLPIPDPEFSYVGPPVSPWSSGVSSGISGVFLIPASEFLKETMVLGLKLFGSTAGIIKVFIAKPLCTLTERVYCVRNSSCILSNNSCPVQPTKHQCPVSQPLCVSDALCQQIAGDCAQSVYTPSSATLPLQGYTVACDLGTFNISHGYNMFVLADDKACLATPGDILGWAAESSGGSIATRSGGTTVLMSSVTVNAITKGFNITSVAARTEHSIEPILQAFGSKAVVYSSNLTAGGPGSYTYRVQVNNTLTPSLAQDFQIRVQSRVSSISPVYPDGFDFFGNSPGAATEISVNISSATNVTLTYRNTSTGGVIWEGSLPDSHETFVLHTIRHSVDTIGQYTISVEARNMISWVSTSVRFVTLEEISGLRASLLVPGLTVYQGLVTSFNASVARGERVRYQWIFGTHGNTSFTTNKTASFMFSKCGVVNVTAIASNLASKEVTSFPVDVKTPVIVTSSAPVSVHNTAIFNCTLLGGFTGSYLYRFEFGDGGLVQGVDKVSVNYTYTSCGWTNVTCSVGHVVPLFGVLRILVLEPVTGLALKPFPGVELFDNKTFTAVYKTGNNLSFEWCIYNDRVAFIALCHSNTLKYFFNVTGTYTVIVNASNAISSASYQTSFHVAENITGVTLVAYPNPARTNTTVHFNVTKGTGTQVEYRLDFGDGYVIRHFDGPFLKFNRTFQASKWQIILTANNNVSRIMIFYNLTVQDVIKDLSLTIDAESTIDGMPYVTMGRTKQLFLETRQGTDVFFEWEIDGVKYKKEVGRTYGSGNTILTRDHKFPFEKDVVITVVARNLISTSSAELRLRVQEGIEGFAVNIPKGVVWGQEVFIKPEITRGRNVTYAVDFGDGSPSLTFKETSRKNYSSLGYYKVSVTASNQLLSVTINQTIAVQRKIDGFVLTRALSPTAVNYTVTVYWKYTTGDNVTFVVRFGDNSPIVNVTSLPVMREVTAHHSYSTAGLYTIHVTAVNFVDKVGPLIVYALVAEAISGFSANISATVVQLNEQVLISTSLTRGSNVTFSYYFEDEETAQAERSSETQKAHRYFYPGTFSPKVIAENAIGRSEARTAIVTVTTPPDPVPVSGLEIATPDPCALGNMTVIRVSWATGFMFNCALTFGDGQTQGLNDVQLRAPVLHEYKTTGSFDIEIACSDGNKASATTPSPAKVAYPIAGLNFVSGRVAFANFGERLRVEWTWTAGSEITFQVELAPYGIIPYEQTSNRGYADLLPSFFPSAGDFSLTLKAWNAISRPSPLVMTISVRQQIKEAKLSVNPYVRPGFAMMAFVTVKAGSQLQSVWAYDDGSASEVLTSTGYQNYIKAMHKYTTAGVYQVIVTVWNSLSRVNVTLTEQVTVQNPVTEFAAPSIVSVSLGDEAKLTFRPTTIVPSNASYVVDFGNGNHSDARLLEEKLATTVVAFTYFQSGCYQTKITIYNMLSLLQLVINVRVLAPVRNLALHAIFSAESAYSGSRARGEQHNILPVEFPASFRALHDNNNCIKYDWDFGDGTSITAGSKDIASVLYAIPGIYTVRVRAFNPYTNSAEEKTMSVVMIKSIIGLYLASNSPVKPGESMTFVLFCKTRGNNSQFVLDPGNGVNYTFPAPSQSNTSLVVLNHVNPSTRLPFNPAHYHSSVLTHTYATEGIFNARVMAWNVVSMEMAQIQVVVTNRKCRVPEVVIYGGADSVLSAPVVIYGNSFEMTSDVNITCEGDVDAQFVWKVYNADAFYNKNASMPPNPTREVRLPENVARFQSSIIIPKSILKPGIYIICLTVTLSGVGLENNVQQYVKISTPEVQARIAGGSTRTQGWELPLTLSASQSRDPLYPSNKGLKYAWYCELVGESEGPIPDRGCFGNGKGLVERDGDVFPIRAKSLYESVTYKFSVIVMSPDGGRKATAVQMVKVIPGNPPSIKISCVINCEGKMTTNGRLTLMTTCDNCNDSSGAQVEYKWSARRIEKGGGVEMSIWPGNTLTKETMSSVVVMENVFEPDQTYELKVQAGRKGGIWSFVTYEFVTNSPPTSGHCEITPTEGEELKTDFSFTCEKWAEEDTPLMYEVLSEESVGQSVLVWYGPQLKNTEIILSAGTEEENYIRNIVIRVKDVYGAVNDTRFTLKVKPFSGQVSSSMLLGYTSGKDSAMGKALARGNLQEVVQIAKVIASMMNKQTNGDSMSKVRESLINSMHQVADKMRDLSAARQVGETMEVVTANSEELTLASQDNASRIYSKIAERVIESAKQNSDPAVIERVCATAFRGISSVINQGTDSTSPLLNSTNIMADALNLLKIPGENETVIIATNLALWVQNALTQMLDQIDIKASCQGKFELHKEMFANHSSIPESVAVTFIELRSRLFGEVNASLIKSAVVASLELKEAKTSQELQKIPVHGLQDSLIDIYLYKQNTSTSQDEVNTTWTRARKLGEITYHRVAITKPYSSITLEIQTYNCSPSLDVYFRRHEHPTNGEHDLKFTMLNESGIDVYKAFVSSRHVNETGYYYFGITHNSTCGNNWSYLVVVYSSSCYYWDTEERAWSTAGCEVGNQTTRSVTHCRCNHLTWFGADFFIPPNKIDLNKAFDKLDKLYESVALLTSFCVILGLYIIAVVWARRKDKKDFIKVGLIAVPDNDISDMYRFEVTMYTGRGKSASTTSNVGLIMYGEIGESLPVTLLDENRPVFEPAGVDSFLVTSPNPLGPLTYIRIWHDNTGSNPSWYLNQVCIRNIESNERFYFLCYRWFACDEGDGKVDRTIPVAGEEELSEFMYLFRSKTARDFSDAHLWFSIALRPARSVFTRVQRVSCCFSLLLCTMFTNVLWYEAEQTTKDDVIFESGFIKIHWHELLIGIQSSILVFPINLLIIQIFRNLEPWQRNASKDNKKDAHVLSPITEKPRALTLNDIKPVTKQQDDFDNGWISDKEAKKVRFTHNRPFSLKRHPFQANESLDEDLLVLLKETKLESAFYGDSYPVQETPENIPLESMMSEQYMKKPNINLQDDRQGSEESMDCLDGQRPLVRTYSSKEAIKKKKKVIKIRLLPRWFLFVGWFLCFATAVTAGFFTLLYGNYFDQEKQHQWLVSMFVSIVQDILISQPLKVIGFALMFALIFKKPQIEDDEKLNTELAKDEQWIERHVGHREKRRNALSSDKPNYMPPDPSALKRARLQRFKERKMMAVIQEIVFYALFVWVVLVIAYGHRDPNAHVMNQGLKDVFAGRGNTWMVDYTPPKPRNTSVIKFLKVSDPKQFWNWTKAVLVPGLYNGPWYNGKSDKPGYLSDRTSWKLGTARLRQLRVRCETCEVSEVYRGYGELCNGPYTWDTEDTTSVYKPGWQPALPNYTTTDLTWKYRTSTQLKSLPFLGRLALYSGGGYGVDLGPNEDHAKRLVARLESQRWLDNSTRAIFVEFTVYNAYVNLYSVGYLLLEVLSTGGAFPSAEFLVTRIDRYVGDFMIFVLLCELMFVLFTMLFTYREGKLLFKVGFSCYFSEYWNWVELLLISLSWSSIVIYFVRFAINEVTKLQYHAGSEEFVNIHSLAASDYMFGCVFAFVVFLVSLKFLRLFRFNKRMSLLASTLRCSAKELAHFSIVFGLVFMAFVHFCYLIFSKELYIFYTVLSSVETLISIMLGKFSYERLLQTNRFLAPCMFLFYSIVVVFVLINMFISIIIENFKRVKSDNDLQSNEYEIVEFITEQFRDWLAITPFGMFTSSKNRIGSAKTMSLKKPSYKKFKKTRQCDILNDRVDRLIDLIQKVHGDDEKEDFLRNDGEISYIMPSKTTDHQYLVQTRGGR